MERAEWRKLVQEMTEAVYDRISPAYWATFGLYANETQQEYLRKLLGRVPPCSTLLSAACGAGRYDGMLLEAGHKVVGIDQSAGMLRRAREHFPEARYEKMSLQEMDFHAAFEGAICLDAMEHIFPEDWPGILQKFQQALKSSGVLYFTAEMPEPGEVEASFERAKAMGLPVVFGEVADEVEASYARVKALTSSGMPGDLTNVVVYHYYPSLEQVHTWIGQAGLAIEEEGTGHWYEHLIVKKK